MHFDGFFASVYWATFPRDYLHTIRNVNVDDVAKWNPKIKLCHTQPYNLFQAEARTEFIQEFVALVRFVAAGEAKVAHLRKGGRVIHRSKSDVEEPVLRPPQQALDRDDELWWRHSDEAELYGA